MGTTLRLGFAMGGGVSLGTFNGAALSEAIKLAILRGIDSKGNRFGRVEVDVFSGASAGAMSLGLMLRGLVHQTDTQRTAARTALKTQFGGEFTGLPQKLKLAMVAAQVVQDIQKRIWVHEISLDRLLADGPSGTETDGIRYTAGVVNRAAVDEIARQYFDFPGGVDLSRRKVLADRVLYACTLANVTPIFTDARNELPIEKGGIPALSDGMTTKMHRELRVFDLCFKDIASEEFDDPRKHPGRWVRYHVGGQVDGKVGDLNRRKTWAKIAATAVASGAFPLAFEPVVLKRDDWEFHKEIWPFKDGDRKDYNFTYVDGGSYNNEPIREAFRMASFIDAHSRNEDFERCIIFVDPNIEKPEPSLRVPVHQRFLLDDPNILGTFDGYDLERGASLDRLIPHAMALVGGVIDQAKSIEGDKVFQVRNKFALRKEIRPLLAATLTKTPRDADLEKLHDFCEKILTKDQQRMMIPPGALSVAGELERVIAEAGDNAFDAIKGGADAFVADRPGANHKHLWLRALSFVAFDLAMNLTGKNDSNKLIAIAPLSDPMNKRNPGFITLPGGRIAGFAGFMSSRPGVYETDIGRWCAQNFMQLAALIEHRPLPDMPDFSDQEVLFQQDLDVGMDKLADRLIAMIAQAHVEFLSAIPQWLMKLALKSKLTRAAAPERDEVTYEFRIKLPAANHKDFEFDGPGLGDQDIKPVRVGDDHYLITFATLDKKSGAWRGAHVTDDAAISVDKDGLLFDSSFCTIKLPGEGDAKIRAADLMPYPVFLAEIDDHDKNEELSADRWRDFIPQAIPLADTIFPGL